MSNYLLIGAVGGPNFGDEAILRAWIWFIRRHAPAARVYCDGWRLDTLPDILEDKAESIDQLSSLWAQVWKQELSSLNADWLKIRQEYYQLDMLRGSVNALDRLSRLNISHIHLVGGGFINSIWPRNYALLRLILQARSYLRATAVMTGQGLCPARPDFRRGIGGIFLGFDRIDVRDQESARLFGSKSFGKNVCTGDDALLYFSGALEPPIRWLTERALVVCLQNDLFPGAQAMEHVLSCDVLRLCQNLGVTTVIFAAAMEDDVSEPDSATAARLAEFGLTIECSSPMDLVRSGFPMSRDGLVVTSRYHPHLFAALSGVRGVALSTNDYYIIKHRTVCAMGGRWPILVGIDALRGIALELEKVSRPDTQTYSARIRDHWVRKKLAMAQDLLTLDVANTKSR